jgi:predicted alpha-1,2-mannosidase
MNWPHRVRGARLPRHGTAFAVALLSVVAIAFSSVSPAGAAARRAASATGPGADLTASATGPGADLTALVNPFIGTENAGLDFPAVGAPFGMVQERALVTNAPGTKSSDTGCYAGSGTEITGFSQMTINGCRFNYVPMMPTTGPVTSTDPSQYESSFSIAQQQAHPDYYSVRLAKYGIDVGLTATTRTGWQRYTFPRTSQANVLFNVGSGVSDSAINIVGDRTVEGWVQDSHKTYFVAQLSRPFIAYGTWQGSQTHPGSRQSENPSSNGGWVSFDTTTNDAPVVAKVGLSYTGLAGARKNLAAETNKLGFDFGAAHRSLHKTWNTMLHKVDITGGTHDQQVEFYTALYHSTLDPNVIGDVDGRYMGFDGKLHQANGFTPYSNLSLWDTNLTQNQLVEMLDPKVAHDVDLSILAIARQQGWLPRWFLENQEDNIMTGDPITPYLVEGWSKGLLTGQSAQEAYKYLRENATQLPPASTPMNGRAGVDYYQRLGYIPYGLHVTADANCPTESGDASCCPTHGNDNDCYYPASAPLEYSAADASLALMAKGLGHGQDATMFAQRGQWYHNLFDSTTGLFRPRTLDGTWLAPYNTKKGDHAFHEGDPIQYQWLVPQDPAGLVKMLGGNQVTTQRLDQFFAYPDLLTDPAGTARHQWVSDPYDYYGPSTYDPDNEPDLLAPYLYSWTGQPGRTATVVRAAETLYTNSPTGITGNDDMGEMSAWYVMSAIGLYPTMSGSNFYVVTTPEFPHTSVKVGHYGNTQGGTVSISAPGASMSDRYIASAQVNGKDSQHDWVSQADIAHGATIDYALSTSPTNWATAPQDAPPSVDQASDPEHQLGARLSPAAAVVQPSTSSSSTQSLTLTVMAMAPGSAQVHVAATPPAGWTVSAPANVSVASNGLPTQVKVPITVTAPAGTQPGNYAVSVTASLAGATAVHKTATVSAQAPGRCASQTSTSCAVDLSGDYNTDGVATTANPLQGDFDGQGSSYAANLLPAPGPVTLGGITYQAPSTSGTDPNFVKADGQTLALPAGNYSELDVVGAASGGSTGSDGRTAVVTYSDGSTASVHLKLTDWGASAPAFKDNSVALQMPYRLTPSGQSSSPVSLYQTKIPLDAGKTVRSISLPAPSVPIWVAPGLTGVTWNHDSDLQIYAMTLQG